MAKTIANVLTGVATLSVREPNDARAEWSTVQQYAGTHSVKLSKTGSGNAGSTHVQITPVGDITLTEFVADPTDYSFWHYCGVAGVVGNFIQFELRFEDPDSDAWAEVTVVNYQTYTSLGSWVKCTLSAADLIGWGGIGEEGASFFDWSLGTAQADIITDIDLDAAVTDCGPWVLARVRCELWESSPARYAYVDSVEIDGTAYTIEPGGTGIAISLDSPGVEVGYTEDGVTLEYNADTADIEVEEETVPIDRVITKETIAVTCNMAETSLANIDNAMAGSALVGSILKVGSGVMKTMNLQIVGVTPAGFIRSITIPKATAMGTVGMSYKKGEKTVIPVTFQALKPDAEEAMTIVDNAV